MPVIKSCASPNHVQYKDTLVSWKLKLKKDPKKNLKKKIQKKQALERRTRLERKEREDREEREERERERESEKSMVLIN